LGRYGFRFVSSLRKSLEKSLSMEPSKREHLRVIRQIMEFIRFVEWHELGQLANTIGRIAIRHLFVRGGDPAKQ